MNKTNAALAKRLAEMDVMSLFHLIINTKVRLPGGGSTGKIEPGKVVRATITSSLARRFYNAAELINGHYDKLAKPNLKTPSKRLDDLEKKVEILGRLFWVAVVDEHPQTTSCSASVREGWKLVGDEKESWSTISPFTKDSRVASSILSQIGAVASGGHTCADEEDLHPVALGEEIVGALEDERLQSLYCLDSEVRAERKKILPAAFISREYYLMPDATVRDLTQYRVIDEYYKGLGTILMTIFWEGVKGLFPVAADAPGMAIRRAWEVVTIPARKSVSEDLGVIMTGFGPARLTKITLAPGASFGSVQEG